MKNHEQEPLASLEYYAGLGVAVLGFLTLNPAEIIVGGVMAWDGNRRRE